MKVWPLQRFGQTMVLPSFVPLFHLHRDTLHKLKCGSSTWIMSDFVCVCVHRSLKLSMPSCWMLLETEDHCSVKCCGFHTFCFGRHQEMHVSCSWPITLVFTKCCIFCVGTWPSSIWRLNHIACKEWFILWPGQPIFLKWSLAHQTHLVVYAASQWLDCMTELLHAKAIWQRTVLVTVVFEI